jgi:hypothetical protein
LKLAALKAFIHLIRNPIFVALLLFLTGFAGVLTFSYRSRAEANAPQIVYIGRASHLDSNLFIHDLDADKATQLSYPMMPS